MSATSAVPARNIFGLWNDHPLYVHFATLLAALVTVTCLILGWNSYVQSRQMVLTAAGEEFGRMRKDSADQIDRLHAPAEALVEWLSVAPLVRATTLEARLGSLRSIAAYLEMQPQLTSVYMGYANGDFFLVRPLRSDADRALFKVPPNAAYLMQSLERDKNAARFYAYDAQLNRVSAVTPDDYAFDPRTRPWYAKAQLSAGVVRTAPYAFFGTGNIGLTVARRAEGAVAGADITLASISAALERARTTPSSQLVIFGNDRRAIAYSNPKRLLLADNGEARDMPPVRDLSPALERAAAEPAAFIDSDTVRAEGREWMVRVAPLKGDDTGSRLAVAVPLDELLINVRTQLWRNLLLALGVVSVTVLVAWLTTRRIVSSLHALSDQVAAIQRFNFRGVAPVHTRISEIHNLSQAMQQMKGTIGRFLDIAQALSAERDLDRLLQRVLSETEDVTGGEGGILYLHDEDGKLLRPAAQRWQHGEPLAPSDAAVGDLSHAVARAARETVAAGHVLAAPRAANMAFLDARFGSDDVTMLTLPLKNRAGGAMGLLCVFFRGRVALPSKDRLALAEAFLGSGALAIDNQHLLQAQKALLDALIALLARAIDAKSPYTYGHCQRVPVLTTLLAQAACDATDGPFAQFSMDDDEWEALHIAGWLHDCGKVTTPEYVVDKATKLETLTDRIHEIRMRFEVLKRDAEIACWKKIAAGAAATQEEAAQAQAELQAQWRTLDEEFAFVAACNKGGETMAAADIERLRIIGARTWCRTLDERLGVSHEEAQRMARAPAQPLPVTEHLLADKPSHIVMRDEREHIAEDNRWDFKLDVPAHKFNRGELYNLSVARGTLTAEERYAINDHIVQSITMLTELPFPAHLKRVAEYAGGHHEKMDGTGYPKRLQRNEMSVQARILAIADIFEALTAADRPYKRGKSLSEAVGIMSAMKQSNHIDPDLFDLFLQSGVYRKFAEQFVAPEDIDAVDINAYLTA